MAYGVLMEWHVHMYTMHLIFSAFKAIIDQQESNCMNSDRPHTDPWGTPYVMDGWLD